jgi:outer membrane protein TolC
MPDPVLSFAHFVENVETRVGPQEHRVGLKQVFPWFGTLGAQKDMAIEAANANYRNLESVRLRLSYEVKAAYYDYFYIGRELQITRDNLELLRFWESVAQSKYKVGLKQHPDVMKAQVELAKLEDHLQSLEEMLEPAAARLRAVLNIPETTRLPLPQSAEVLEVELRRDAVVQAVRSSNPDLQALIHLIDKEAAAVRLAGKLARPRITVGVDYIVTGEALNPTIAESGKDPWMVGVGFSLPIWLGKNRSRSDEARAKQRAAEYSYEDKKDRLLAFTEQVLFNYSDALRKTRLYRDGLVPKAEQSLNASYASYQAGETDFLSVLDAQRQLLEFQLTVERERVRLGKTAAEVEMLTGYQLEQFRR